MDNLTPMLRQYYSIKSEYEDAILFFRLGDFYEMFGSDAEIAARVLDIALTGRDMGKGQRLPMCGVPHHAAEGYLATLIRKGYKVAICDQVGDPKTSKGIVEREVTRVITPGTVIEPGLLDDRSNNFLVAVCRQHRYYGLAAVDISTGYFGLTEIKGEHALEKLWDELGRLAPAECLVEPGLAEEQSWQATAPHQVSCSLSTFQDRAWRLENAESRMRQHFDVRSLSSFGIEEQTAAIRAGGALLAYLEETQKRSLTHITKITVYSTENYMLMETATRRNLELTETIRDGEHKGSLLWLLDQTVTAIGARLLRQWLLQPVLDKQEIEGRLDAVEELTKVTPLRSELREQLQGVHDIERLVGRITFGSANPRDLAALRESLRCMPQVRRVLEGTTSKRLKDLAARIDVLPDITNLLEQSLVDEPPVSAKEGGIIAPGYVEHLDELRHAAKEGKTWIAAFEAQERERTGIKSLKVGFNRVFGYYLEVTKANLANVPQEYQRKQTLANSERYITPELKDKESLVIGAEDRAMQLEYDIFVDIRNQVAEASPRLLELARTIGQLDVLASLADVAVARDYARPVILDEPMIDIKSGRHPVVEAMLPPGQFVPNDVYLDANSAQLIILTGPNMAGKSTYLRMVALITLMAQMGSFVPAEMADIGLVDRIFTRVGAADDLGTGQSTFMVEMNEVNTALSQATPRSLIVIDELGRGTSTYDGMALAQAIAEYIHDVAGARTIFSTHYHELAKLALTKLRIRNLRMEVWEEGQKIVFLYKVGEGAADRSYGIHVARLAGLPNCVIKRAQVILHDLEPDVAYRQLDLARFFLAEDASLDTVQVEEVAAGAESGTEKSLVPHDTGLILEEIEAADLSSWTPLEALNRVADWQARLRKG